MKKWHHNVLIYRTDIESLIVVVEIRKNSCFRDNIKTTAVTWFNSRCIPFDINLKKTIWNAANNWILILIYYSQRTLIAHIRKLKKTV